MSEKLIIKNFGPIKHFELDLKRFNVLIGEQATGKSTVAKVLAVCRYFSYIIEDNADIYSSPNLSNFSRGLSSWGLNGFLSPESHISYSNKHYSLVAELNHLTYNEQDQEGEVYEYSAGIFMCHLTPISKEFTFLINELNKIKPKPSDHLFSFDLINWTIPTSFFQNEVSAVMDNPFYLPAERGLQSIFSLGKNSIQNISDSLFNQFARLDQIARLFKKDTFIEPLDITYKNIDGQGYIKKSTEDTFYSLYNAATGYQSTIPIVLTVKNYEVRKKSKTFIIEEPELNLFPTAQQNLIEYLVNCSNTNNNSILLTTHSPYILTSLNNLIYAHHVGKSRQNEVNLIINEKTWLNPDDVSAYMLLSNGTCEDIFDRQENLIKAEKIDGVSRILNQKFDDLLTLEFSGNESN